MSTDLPELEAGQRCAPVPADHVLGVGHASLSLVRHGMLVPEDSA
ncbi:MAG: hypothetical protein ACRDSE_00685 [Pseudonocardiaceae bacterium]